MKKYGVLVFGAIILFCLTIVFPSQSSAAAKFFTFAASPSTSSMYPYWVAVGKAVQTIYPEYRITVTESLAAVDISNRIRTGGVILGNGVSRSDYENYHGLGDFKDDPYLKARTLWYYDMTNYVFMVSKESGIKTWKELDGKRVNTGGTGSSLVRTTLEIFEKLGVKPLIYDASKTDAADAYANRQIVGMPSGGSLPESFVMQMNATFPVNILSFSEDEFKLVTEGHPYYSRGVIPAKTYDGIDYDVLTFTYPQGCQTTSDLSQEDGYKFVKAVWEEGRNIWEPTLTLGPSLKAIDMVLLSPIPIHAGMVQYIKEKGRFNELKPEQIPPEYVDS
jgi:TRAP transporter TAXI family solute receptor